MNNRLKISAMSANSVKFILTDRFYGKTLGRWDWWDAKPVDIGDVLLFDPISKIVWDAIAFKICRKQGWHR